VRDVKKATILMVAVALLVALVAGTAAAKQSGKGAKPDKTVTYVFKGTITGVDPDAGTVAVEVEQGNKAARGYLGSQTFTVVEGYTKIEVDEVEDMSLADLAVGQEVNIQSKASSVENVFMARRISAETPEVEEVG
jgi:ABC-type transport system substrate-binding protein